MADRTTELRALHRKNLLAKVRQRTRARLMWSLSGLQVTQPSRFGEAT